MNNRLKIWKILGCLILAPAITACSPILHREITGSRPDAPGTRPVGTSANVTAVPADPFPAPLFPDPDAELSGLAQFDGKESIFLIATLKGESGNPIFPDADRVGASAAAARLNAIQEKYNLKIVDDPVSVEDLVASLEANIQVDGYTVDLILLPASEYAAFEGKKLLLSPDRIAFFDSEAAYLRPDCSALASPYGISGDALFYPEDRICVYYNSALAERLGLGNLYDRAAQGGWTLADFSELAAAGGLASDLPAEYLIPAASGVGFSDLVDRNGELQKLSSENREKVNAFLESVGEKYTEDQPLDAFLSGNALFYIGKISDCTKFSSLADPWSILPFPAEKSGENPPILQDYREDSYLFLIPRFPFAPERSVQVIAALCSACSGMRKAAYESYLPYLRLNEARIMLAYVLR